MKLHLSDLINPYLSSAKTMKSFLNYFRIKFPHMSDLSFDQHDAKVSLHFYDTTAAITYNIIDECPNMVPKIGSMMCELLRFRKSNGTSALIDYQRISIIAFFSQVITNWHFKKTQIKIWKYFQLMLQVTCLTENVLSLDLIDSAFEVLLSNNQDPEPMLKILCLKVLSLFSKHGFFLDQSKKKMYSLGVVRFPARHNRPHQFSSKALCASSTSFFKNH